MPDDKKQNEGGEVVLHLWLPGYHTPSLNVTKGHHWSQYYQLKKEAVRALLSAIDALPSDRLTPKILRARQRLSLTLLPTRSGKTSKTTRPNFSSSSTRKSGSGAKTKRGR